MRLLLHPCHIVISVTVIVSDKCGLGIEDREHVAALLLVERF
jgi:hypothetical protein